MFSEFYRIADRTVLIQSIYGEVHAMCAGYKEQSMTSRSPDITVTVTPSHIEAERAFSAAEAARENRPVISYPDRYLETLAVYRQIADQMTAFDTVLFHGSAVAVDGVGYLFTAKSGTGKSTHTALWRKVFGDRAVMINDDKPLIRVSPDGVVVYGTPWNGKHHLGTNGAFLLKAICILTRDTVNHIERIGAKEAFPTLLRQTYRPKDPARLMKTLEVLDGISGAVGLYRLGCNMEREAAEVAYHGMNEAE